MTNQKKLISNKVSGVQAGSSTINNRNYSAYLTQMSLAHFLARTLMHARAHLKRPHLHTR